MILYLFGLKYYIMIEEHIKIDTINLQITANIILPRFQQEPMSYWQS
jgi:hypothetical protein